jgi:hypothetical protein
MHSGTRFLSLLLLLLISIKTAAQQREPYAAQWKQADSLIERGLPESARKIADKLYTTAQAEGRQVQMLKAQIYLMRINTSNKEEADSLNIAFAENQIRKTDFPVSALWRSIAAQLYWQYYQTHRYKILSRTQVETRHGAASEAASDFEQWDASRFFERAAQLYIMSLGQKGKLKRIPIDDYDPVLNKGVNTRNLRPTLFDLLAFRAIDFFENDEKDLTRPAYQFVMDDARVFAPAKEFIEQPFPSKDTFSTQRMALMLYQEVLSMHQADSSRDAFLDADLHRLEFAYRYSVHPDKKELYRKALEQIEKTYANNPLSALASFHVAQLMMNEPVLYDEDNEGTDQKPRIDLRAVKAKLDAIIAKYPESEGGIAAQQLLQTIAARMLGVTAEEAVLPAVPSKVLVTYKNLGRCYIRIIKIDPDDYREQARNGDGAYVRTMLDTKPVQAFSVALPAAEDYRQHTTEVMIPALPIGMYAVIVSADAAFSRTDNALGLAACQSTRLAVIISDNHSKDAPGGYVLDRADGTPVPDTRIVFFREQWNGGQYEDVAAAPTRTAADGSFHIPAGSEGYSGLMLKKGEDVFYTNGYFSFNNYNSESKTQERTFFFTDRSIYRPGQAIRFKGITVKTSGNGKNNDVVSGKKIEVSFYDVNSQKLSSQILTTNEWGSVAGTFTVPQGGLTGTMRIEGGNSSTYISIEEYKRPKFYIDWDTLKSDYALNESVSITGHALAYAGNNLDGTRVKYRVVRRARFPYWWYAWRWGGVQRSPEQEIAQGTTTTDASGKFIVSFQTIPDRNIDERSLPVFTYTIYADVTDLNGETRSGEKSISAGYRSLQITADIPGQASRSDLDTVHILTQNLNGDFVPASIRIKVARLEQPEVVYRKRYWPVPDQFTMSEAAYRSAFPLDAYKDEDDYRKWPEAEINLERTLTTTKSGNVILPKTAFFRNSWYCITITAKDKHGKPIEEKRFVQVWDAEADDKPYAVLFVKPQQQIIEPGSVAKVDALTGTTGIHSIRAIQTMDKAVAFSQHDMREVPLTWTKNITEADRGGLSLSYITVKDNRVYVADATIDVPWTNKDLNIEWETHRDKLQPGQQETWTMIIRGNKKDKVAAEMAATLYDASLDAFKPHGWSIGSLFPSLYASREWQSGVGFTSTSGRVLSYFTTHPPSHYDKRYDDIILFGEYRYRGLRMGGGRNAQTAYAADALQLPPGATAFARQAPASVEAATDPVTGIAARYGDASGSIKKKSEEAEMAKPLAVTPAPTEISLRKNLQETAFFYPQLHTDADGAIRINFGIPEALTEWKLLGFAHTKDMRTGLITGKVKTQKDLMVQPGLPRFLRQGDDIVLTTKIVNLTDKDLSGETVLDIVNAATGKSLNTPFRLNGNNAMFHADKNGSTVVRWNVHVPESLYEPVLIRMSAKAGAFTDGEENALPVLTNRMLVTETLPMWMNGPGTKSFSFDKLKASSASNTLAQHRLTLEYTANPAWYAVKALPYIMEYPYECAEQTFNRYYANALAAHILDKAPRVKEIFKRWEMESMLSSFGSPLQNNQELKSALLEETPWVLNAQSESEQRKNIALLFQTARLANDLDKAARKLEDMFLPESGWPWFKGDNRPDRYITQYIVTGIGRLKHLGVRNEHTQSLAERALVYLDRQMQLEYDELVRTKANLQEQHIGYLEIQYGYMRSFFPEIESKLTTGALGFYRFQANKFWPQFNPYLKGMMAITAHREGRNTNAADMIQSLKETSIQKDELGMYWMEVGRSWWWYDAPIEAQSLLIECFSEVAGDNESVDRMKRWLLKQKQTNAWPTTKATADACYALLLQGTQWLNAEPQITVRLGDKTLRSQEQKSEAGTGYFKVQYPGAEINPAMGNITLTVSDESTKQPGWGAVYWQYFEDMDKISSAATPLQVKKQLFIEKNGDRGPVLEAIQDNGTLKVGDKVKARIEIIVDRDMEYVHLKDGRAACFEPVNVLSGYRWQGGLGYYESTRDASSNFFFSYLPKGKYVFEYPVFVTNAGDFSNGIATIQCMYAPEFAAHSEGIRVSVK